MPLDVTVASVHSLTPRVKQFLLHAEDHTFTFAPGQHVSVAIPGEDRRVYRPYSPVSLPGTERIAIAVKRYSDGTGSTWMHRRTIGDTITLTEPSGNLHLHDRNRDAFFLCTGTGLTPILSMATQYVHEGNGHATVLFGERTQRDLMFRETLNLLSASHSRFSAEYVLSDEEWSGRTGYVQHHVSELVSDVEAPHFYVCGVPEMVVETKAVLEDLGVPNDHVFSEGWEEGAVEE